MNYRFAALSVCLAGVLLAPSPSVSHAYETWPADDGQVIVDIEAYTSFASSQYQHTGDVFDLLDDPEVEGAGTDGRFQSLGLYIDGEFGLFDGIAIFVRTRLQRVSVISDFATSSVSGLSDVRLGGKWQLVDGALTLTIAPSVKFPTGYTADPGPYLPSLGNGVNEYDAHLWVGKRFDDAPFYFEVGTGYRFRGTRIPRGGGPKLLYADEIPYDLEIGFDFTEQLGLLLLVDGVVGLGQPATIDAIELQPLTQTYTHIGGGFGYRITGGFRLVASYRTTVAGVNALNRQFIGLTMQADYGI